ncbi:hypothetical protein ACN38_g11841 [Penicillium nordicum]|uniref:Uncharacterized protein n=1 Tax=Penicillium nordicum TaxID=229535 RepID=A0A0M9WAD6_9EURO|nr:hypothetical protein ACN38_g11841 [Penicillium nordicum]
MSAIPTVTNPPGLILLALITLKNEAFHQHTNADISPYGDEKLHFLTLANRPRMSIYLTLYVNEKLHFTLHCAGRCKERSMTRLNQALRHQYSLEMGLAPIPLRTPTGTDEGTELRPSNIK